MSLESIVNTCLSPIESLAKMVYDVAPGFVQKGMDYVGKAYSTVKEDLQKHIVRPVDKYFLKPVDKYVVNPILWTGKQAYNRTLGAAVGYWEKYPIFATSLLTLLLFTI